MDYNTRKLSVVVANFCGYQSRQSRYSGLGFDVISPGLSCLFLLNAEEVVGHNLTCTRYEVIGITTII